VKNARILWTSFIDGPQIVFLITDKICIQLFCICQNNTDYINTFVVILLHKMHTVQNTVHHIKYIVEYMDLQTSDIVIIIYIQTS